MGGRERKFTNMYIKNFGDALNDQSLSEMFAAYGKIVSAKVMVDESNKSRGFGFVSFKDPEYAERAVVGLNGTAVGGREVYVGRAQKKTERVAELRQRLEAIRNERMSKYQGANLYIKNLHESVDDDRLRAEFARYGEITSAKVMTENGRSKGFGFVCFSAPEEATRAVTEMNGRLLASKPLYVALAQRKEERKQHLHNQLLQRMNSLRVNPQTMVQQASQMHQQGMPSIPFSQNPSVTIPRHASFQ